MTMSSQMLEAIMQQKKDVVTLTEEFNESIRSFDENFQDDCQNKGCEHYQTKIRMLYKDYYTGPVPGRWDESRSAYRVQLAKDIEAGVPLSEVHARVLEEKERARVDQKEIISAWRERELSNHPYDLPEIIQMKAQATAMLNGGGSLEDVLKYMNDESYRVLSLLPGNAHQLFDKINTAKSADEKRQARKEWHTTPQPEDSQQTRHFRQQLISMFDYGLSLDEIENAVIKNQKQHDARIAVSQELIQSKRSKIEENNYAWRAHMRAKKEKAEKAEKATTRAAERKAAQLDHNTHRCSGFDESGNPCKNPAAPVDEERGPIECDICDIAIKNGCNTGRSFFCSEACAKRSWATHKARSHPCDAENCLNTPTPDGATCSDCDQIFGEKSTFCSPQCLESNKETHIEKVHGPLREKMAQKINQELEYDFSRYDSMTEEELQNEINLLQGQDPESEPENSEEMKKHFSALSELPKSPSPGSNKGSDSDGKGAGSEVKFE